MDKARQAQKAAAFRAMHDPKNMLVLPNAWDAVSARVFEAAGFPALATTSAGVAWALGYADGQFVPREEMIAAVRRIARVVSVPVTADLEAGYGPKPEDVAETVRRVQRDFFDNCVALGKRNAAELRGRIYGKDHLASSYTRSRA